VAGGQDYEVRYTAKRRGSPRAVKKPSRKWAAVANGSNAGSNVRNRWRSWRVETMSRKPAPRWGRLISGGPHNVSVASVSDFPASFAVLKIQHENP